MKFAFPAIALLAAVFAFAQEALTNDAPSMLDGLAAETAPTEATAPTRETPAEPVAPIEPIAETTAVPEAATTDEIDLDEVDDTALDAARPKIRAEGDEKFVDVDCDEATLADILRQFRKTTGENIISSESTNLLRRVSVTLRHTPWHQALTAILNARGFRLDERDGIYRVVEDRQTIPVLTTTFQLNHASAKELAELFNTSYAPRDKSGKPMRQIATCFEGANVVVVTAEEKTISDCAAIVKAIDHAVAQVYIEARFLELSSQAMHKLGLNWSSLESWGVTAKNMKFGVEKNYGRLADYGTKSTYTKKNMQKTGASDTSSDSSSQSGTSSSTSRSTSTSDTYTDMADGANAIQNSVLAPTAIGEAAGAGLSSSSMGWANAMGFSGQLSADDFSLALSAFEELGEGKIFSNPKIIVSNGKMAKVDMTTKEPNVTIDSNYTGNNSQNLSVSTKLEVIPGEDKQMFAKEAFFSYGIELTVKPRISPDGLITVEVVPTISEKTSEKKVEGADTAAPYTTYPIINVKRLTTEFTMKDGSTAVIGGLTQTTEEDVDSGIPYLRKIPWIGPKLFGWKSRQKVQKEIIICVTVGIANPSALPKDIGLPKNAVLGREYVEGRRLEPGDRVGSAAKVLSLDMRTIEEQRETPSSDDAAKNASEAKKGDTGSVSVTLSK